ncbi:MAG: CHASE2 domain-containing protein [Pseudomonadota bacterium]
MLNKIGSLKNLSLIFVLISSLISVALQYWKVTEYFDWVLYDLQMPLWAQPAPDDVVIIAIDEKSITKLGRWPWSRSVHAQLIDNLSTTKTGPIVFDILFSEPTLHSQLSSDKSNPDQQLAKSISLNGKVILPMAGIITPGVGIQELLPIDSLFQASHFIGHTDLELDTDSKFRRVFLYAGLNQARWPNLAVAALMAADTIEFLPGRRTQDNTYQQNFWARDHYVMLPFIGSPKHFKTLSYADVLDGTIPIAKLKDKVIFIGVTAKGIRAAYPTPLRLHQVMSGVEIQANIYQALRTENTICDIPLNTQLLISFVITFLASLLLSLRNWAKNPFYLIAIIFTLLVLSESLLLFAHLYLPVVSIISGCIITSLSISWLYLHRLKNIAETDALTGIYNRYYFDINFSLLWKQAKQNQRSLCLVIIDIDYFKAYNDCYGHNQGDQALIAVARELQYQCNKYAYKACRIGGEEFACLIDNSSLITAKAFAEQLREKVLKLKLEHQNSLTSSVVTISIGLAAMVPNKTHTLKKLFKAADRALYQAKELGRNRLVTINMDGSGNNQIDTGIIK